MDDFDLKVYIAIKKHRRGGVILSELYKDLNIKTISEKQKVINTISRFSEGTKEFKISNFNLYSITPIKIDSKTRISLRKTPKEMQSIWSYLRRNLFAILTVLLVVLFPIILGWIFVSSPLDNVFGSNDAWIGFWGSYGGGLITVGASAWIARFISKKEVKLVKEEEKQRRINSFKSELLIKDFELLKKEVQEVVDIIYRNEERLNTFLTKIKDFYNVENDERFNLAIEFINLEGFKNSDKLLLKEKIGYIEGSVLPGLMIHKGTSFYNELINPMKSIMKPLIEQSDVMIRCYVGPYILEPYNDKENSGLMDKELLDSIEKLEKSIVDFMEFKLKVNSLLFKQLENLMYQYLS